MPFPPALRCSSTALTQEFSPIVADRFGRKPGIIIGCVIMIAGAIMQGAANGIGVFTGGRVLLGFGVSFTQMSSPMLLTEICHPQHRARVTMLYNCLWNVGALSKSPTPSQHLLNP